MGSAAARVNELLEGLEPLIILQNCVEEVFDHGFWRSCMSFRLYPAAFSPQIPKKWSMIIIHA